MVEVITISFDRMKRKLIFNVVKSDRFFMFQVKKDYLDFIIEEIKSNYNLSKLDFIVGKPSKGAYFINTSKKNSVCDN